MEKYELMLTPAQVLILDELLSKSSPNRATARAYADLCDAVDVLKARLPAK